MKYFFLPALLVCPVFGAAQVDTAAAPICLVGYMEIYYAYDFNQPRDHNRPAFLYSHSRHNEVNLNLGFVRAAYTSDNVRANLALAAGSYMNANYAAETGVMKNVFEANAGIKLSANRHLWLDAGIFSSHIGFESAISKDCWTLTRSIPAENSPYYESGLKLTYISHNRKWLVRGLILNGWQHIRRPEGNSAMAFGTQITFTPHESITLNYSTFIGNDHPDEEKRMRYFHNFFGQFHFTDEFHLTTGLDYGVEQISKGSKKYHHWFSPVVMMKYDLGDRWSVTGRGELYRDRDEVIISTASGEGFEVFGFSLNVDYRIQENALCRMEGRAFYGRDEIFLNEDRADKTYAFVTASLSVSF